MSQLVIRSTHLRRRLAADPPREANLDMYSALLLLEKLLVERPKGWAAGLAYRSLCSQYPEAFAAMGREIAPDLYQEHLEREHRRDVETARLAREHRAARRRRLRDLQRAAKALGGPTPPTAR